MSKSFVSVKVNLIGPQIVIDCDVDRQSQNLTGRWAVKGKRTSQTLKLNFIVKRECSSSYFIVKIKRTD